MSLDPFAQAEAGLTRAREERDALQRNVDAARVEVHQLRRRIERFEERESKLHATIAELEVRAEHAEDRATTAERATRNHAGRTT